MLSVQLRTSRNALSEYLICFHFLAYTVKRSGFGTAALKQATDISLEPRNKPLDFGINSDRITLG